MRKNNNYGRIAISGMVVSMLLSMGTMSQDVQAAKLAKKVTIKASTKTLYIGGPASKKSVKLKAKVKPAKAKQSVKWKSSKKNVAKVTSSGMVTAKKTGKTTITATTKDKAKKKASIQIQVKKYVKPTSITVTGSTTLNVGSTGKLNVTVNPAKTTENGVTFTSSNSSVVAVDADGVLTAKKAGTANITVKTKVKNAKGNYVTKTVKVTVKEVTVKEVTTNEVTVKEVVASDVKMIAARTMLLNGVKATTEITLNPTLTPENVTNKTLKWSSDNIDVATVDANGKVTAKKEGIANITVQTSNGKKAVCKVTVKGATVSVHDPSVIKGKDGYYYIFGSHTAWAKTNSLIGWSTFGNNISADKTDTGSIYAYYWNNWAAYNKNGVKNQVNDGTATDLSGNQWAPDVIWNEKMQKYCMYMSVNGPDYNSVIVMATADSLDGNWTVAGPVVYSGFTNGEGVANHDVTLTDYTKVTGEETVAARYGGSAWNPYYGTNAIDPCVKYDKDGNLWMIYGSWYGGIYMLELDEATGLRDYERTYAYDTDDTDGTTSDPYMGIRVAGGSRASGEGAYLIEKDGYYYMFLSYGGLVADGGYNMRVFRSENISGPYTDKAGYSALRTETNGAGNTVGNIGIRLMAGYKWNCNTNGYLAQGHNSALVDDDGKMYLVYHTRAENSGEGHYVLTHQMFMSEDGWLCVAPYKYGAEEISETGYTKDEVLGTYEYLVQNPAQKNGTCATSTYITLGADGSVGGLDNAASWEMKDGKPYVTFTLDGVEYKGVFSYGYDETENRNKVMTFTAVGDNNICIWGSKTIATVKTAQAAQTSDAGETIIATTANADFYLPTTGRYGSKITWSSADTNVITVDGRMAKINRRLSDTSTTLTATITNGAHSSTKEFTVTVEKYDVSVEATLDADEVSLPTTIGNAAVTWTSSNPDVISTDGKVAKVINDTQVTLTAVLTLDDEKVTKIFDVTVEGIVIDITKVVKTDSIELPTEAEGFAITWRSGDESIINPSTGAVVKPAEEKVIVTLTAVIGDDKVERAIEVTVLPENFTEYVYSQDYENVTDISSVLTSANLSHMISIATEGDNKFLQLEQDGSHSGNRGALGNFSDAVNTLEDYVVEFDLAINSGNVIDRSQSQFVLTSTDTTATDGNNGGISAGYILKLSTGPNSTTWTINDSDQTVEIAQNTWIHVSAVVSAKNNTVDLTITAGDTQLYKGVVSGNGSGYLQGMYILSGRGSGLTKVDNIKVY